MIDIGRRRPQEMIFGKGQHNSSGIMLCLVCLFVVAISALGLALFSTIMVIKINVHTQVVSHGDNPSTYAESECIVEK